MQIVCGAAFGDAGSVGVAIAVGADRQPGRRHAYSRQYQNETNRFTHGALLYAYERIPAPTMTFSDAPALALTI
jgi:hypothetical protein